MNIVMAGIDYNLANLETRELFSFTKTALEKAYYEIKKNSLINGTVIISTCNRTEIYLSCKEDIIVDPFEILCQLVKVDFNKYKHIHRIKKGDDVMKHLCEVACGIKSQVWGEDQIISQVKNAILCAREEKATDSVLEVLFRNAVAAAKKVKTVVKLNSRESSVVFKALDILKKHENVKNVLVIGNGEIGRLMSEVLAREGYEATITLRQYRHGTNIIPNGVEVVEYDKRYEKMNCCQGVISATLSPHHTVMYDQVIKNCTIFPEIFIDLAVPRDIDPEVEKIKGTVLFDIDNLCADEMDERKVKQLQEIELITDKYLKDYRDWCSYKKGLLCV